MRLCNLGDDFVNFVLPLDQESMVRVATKLAVFQLLKSPQYNMRTTLLLCVGLSSDFQGFFSKITFDTHGHNILACHEIVFIMNLHYYCFMYRPSKTEYEIDLMYMWLHGLFLRLLKPDWNLSQTLMVHESCQPFTHALCDNWSNGQSFDMTPTSCTCSGQGQE